MNNTENKKQLQSFVKLGELLRLEREKQGLSIEDVAKLADCSKRTIRILEEGKNDRYNMVVRIAKALNCSIIIVDKI